jgi:hypothetical protein
MEGEKEDVEMGELRTHWGFVRLTVVKRGAEIGQAHEDRPKLIAAIIGNAEHLQALNQGQEAQTANEKEEEPGELEDDTRGDERPQHERAAEAGDKDLAFGLGSFRHEDAYVLLMREFAFPDNLFLSGIM